MSLSTKTVSSLSELKEFLAVHSKALFYASKSSTVIPFSQLERYYQESEVTLVNLSALPKRIELKGDILEIEGPLTWQEARDFCHGRERELPLWPTEESACILAGLATSATGERSFHSGSLSDQVLEITYLDKDGAEKVLSSDKPFVDGEILTEYQESHAPYRKFKNAPFPRFERETDLMIGTEGQLGVIISAKLKTLPLKKSEVLFIRVGRWEKDFSIHLQILETVQKFRDRFYCVEFLDCNSLEFIQEDQRPAGGSDLIFIEYPFENQQEVFENFVEELEGVREEDVFVMERSKFQKFRMDVPRGIQEYNSRNQIVKKGTDVQVRIEDFKNLMECYREFSESGIEYFLFGHFGDAHLHFNFLANKEQEEECGRILDRFYDNIRTKLICSPFAEHGIGLIKQKYVKPFYGSVQLKMFKELKSIHDPHKQFFPKGFMWSAIES